MRDHIALKVRLYPTEEQSRFLNKTLGCCRMIYNTLLADRISFYDTNIRGKELTKEEKSKLYKTYKMRTEKQLKEEFPFLKEVSSVALQQSSRDLFDAFSNFYKGKAKFPTFHSKHKKNSFRELNVGLDWKHRKIKLPKIGYIRFRHNHRPDWLSGLKLCRITVSRHSSGNYYASLMFDIDRAEPVLKPVSENQAIGLDFSPASAYVDSNGKTGKDYGYLPQKQKLARLLRKYQRQLGRKTKGSHNYEKAKRKLARLELHIANARKDWIEKETSRLVSQYSVIGVEDLTLQGLMKASRNAKNYVDVSWNSFCTRLVSKSVYAGCQVIQAARFYPSSRLCHVCNYKNTDLTLKDRHWTCPVCNTEHDRDVNAAVNLKNFALNNAGIPKDIRESMPVEDTEADDMMLTSDAECPEKQELKLPSASMSNAGSEGIPRL